MICEKRIRDLAPSHPLPVLPSHCGQTNPDIAEMKARMSIMMSTQDNGSMTSEVIKMRQQVEQMGLEKQQLEVSLRDETLANEEQRNYIQILRNALD